MSHPIFRLAFVLCAVVTWASCYRASQALAVEGEAPSISSVSVTGITEQDAMLEAKIDPKLLETTYQFWLQACERPEPLYCESGQYMSSQEPVGQGLIGAGNEAQVVSVDLSNLKPSHFYTYEVVATNSGGKTVGSSLPRPFETLPEGAPHNPAGEAPIVRTGSAFVSDVTDHDATLEAQIEPGGLESTYEFWLSTTDCQNAPASGQCGPTVERVGLGHIAAGDSGQTASTSLSDLEPGHAYEYWVIASNSAGISESPKAEFLALGPLSETGFASNLTQTSVTVSGTVNPRGAMETMYFFEYGATAAYGTSVPATPNMIQQGMCGIPCELTTPQPVSETLAGLDPGSTYHYRLVSSSVSGTSYGHDATFSTAPAPGTEQSSGSPFVAVLTPAVVSTPPITATPSTAKLQMNRARLKLIRALKACKRLAKKHQARCRRRAHRQYASTIKQLELSEKRRH